MNNYERSKKIRFALKIVAAVVMVIVVCGGAFACSQTAGCQRSLKSIDSDFNGGLERKVTVYSYEGEKLAEYQGKFDVSASETRVFFDMENGKRVIIYNAIIINEEIGEVKYEN